MDTRPPRDPVAIILQLITIAVLTWIGSSLARGDAVEAALPPGTDLAGNERLERILTSLDRAVAALRVTAALPPTGTARPLGDPSATDASASEPAAAPPAAAIDGIHAEVTELRTMVARSSTAARHGDPDLYTRAASATAAADSLRRIHARLDRSKGPNAEHAAAWRELLFLTLGMVLERFGKPRHIQINENGTESWVYGRDHTDDTRLFLTFHNGHVISAH